MISFKDRPYFRGCMRHCEAVNTEMGRDPSRDTKAEEVIRRMDEDERLLFNSADLSRGEYDELYDEVRSRMT